MEAVISRRIQPVNRRRMELLGEAGENPTVDQLIRAFLAPVFLESNLARDSGADRAGCWPIQGSF